MEALLAHAHTAEGFLSMPLEKLVEGAFTHERGAALVGRSLGAYQIRAWLGSGGMGDVYRAHDSKLGRDVAIKILPAVFSSDAERLARFEREARLLASLNHPNIATIHGLEKSEGIRALVMELVDWPTIAERLSKGPLPVTEAMAIAIQIADALDAAHERGIVHRDLKPANVKLTLESRVKVLDFGIAKLAAAANGTQDLTSAPTITVGATREGVLLGTAAYMSPEQAGGLAVDKRTDIWAFGVVLYEMLTGTRPFQGNSVVETLAAIVKSEPNWSALPPDTPFLTRRLLRHCLVKDARQRLGDIRDARLDIAESSSMPALDAVQSASPSARREPLAWLAAVAGLLVATFLALFALGVIHVGGARTEPQVIRFDIQPPPGATSTSSPIISPDGRRLVFLATAPGRARVMWVRSLDSLISQPLPGTEDGSYPFWSPDSRFVGFFAGGLLKRIDVGGGPAVALCEAPMAGGGSWSPLGLIVFGSELGLKRISAAGGAPAQLTSVEPRQEVAHIWPQFLPDGRHFVYLSVRIGGVQNAIHVASLDAPTGRPVVATDAQATYATPDMLLFARGSTLMRQAFQASNDAHRPNASLAAGWRSRIPPGPPLLWDSTMASGERFDWTDDRLRAGLTNSGQSITWTA